MPPGDELRSYLGTFALIALVLPAVVLVLTLLEDDSAPRPLVVAEGEGTKGEVVRRERPADPASGGDRSLAGRETSGRGSGERESGPERRSGGDSADPFQPEETPAPGPQTFQTPAPSAPQGPQIAYPPPASATAAPYSAPAAVSSAPASAPATAPASAPATAPASSPASSTSAVPDVSEPVATAPAPASGDVPLDTGRVYTPVDPVSQLP